jgi:hypothetical protein
MFRDGLEMRQTTINLQKELGDAIRGCQQKYGAESWYQEILLALANEAQFNAIELLEGDNNQQVARVAWAARNLLELHYFTRYVLASPDYARRFHEDALCDFQDIMRWLGKIPGIDALVQANKEKLAELSETAEQITEDESFLTARKIARDVFKEGFPFGIANKLLSKFVHPTSVSIRVRFDEQNAPVVKHLMVMAGINFVEHTFPLLAAELRKFHPEQPLTTG